MRDQLLEQRSRQELSESLVLAEKYKKYLDPMKAAMKEKRGGKALSENIIATTARSLHNTTEWLNSMDETTRAINAGSFVDYGYKLVAAVLPNLVADQIVSVQPLKMKSGEVFFLNFRYGRTKGKIAKDSTAIGANTGFAPTSNNYSSEIVEEESAGTGDGVTTVFTPTLSYIPVKPGTFSITTGSVTATDNGSGTLSGTGISAGTINYTSGAVSVTFSAAPTNNTPITATYEYDMEQNPSLIGEVDIDLDQSTVTARPYKLRALYTLDAAWDLQQAHNINADDELVAATASIIRAEIDSNIMANLYNQAQGGIVNFDCTLPLGVSKQEHYDSFIHTLTRAQNLIYQATRMVSGNFCIAGTNVASIIEGMTRFESNGVEANGSFSGPYVAGTLSGRFLIVKNPNYSANTFCVGYKGNSYLYAGYVWAPYRPLYTTNPPVVLDDFIGRRGLYTSGGQKMINPYMYVKGTITNYS